MQRNVYEVGSLHCVTMHVIILFLLYTQTDRRTEKYLPKTYVHVEKYDGTMLQSIASDCYEIFCLTGTPGKF